MSSDEPIYLPTVTTVPQVRFSDTDMMGHISSMSYAAWAEVGRADFFAAVKDPETPWFVVVRLTLDFHSEGRFGEAFTITTQAARIGQKSLTLKQAIRVGDRPVCTIEITMAAFDQKTRKSIPVPTRWRIAEA